NDRPGPVASDQIKTRGAHAVETDIRRFIRVRTRHNTGVKEQNHVVLCGAIVDGPVGLIVIVLQGRGNLAQSAKSRLMKAVDLVENIRIVELDISKADEAIGVLADKFAGFR